MRHWKLSLSLLTYLNFADAEKPDDWDDEEDGEWEAPTIPNPACTSGPGCGEWKRPTKANPAYKGKWSAPLIDNPEYKVGPFLCPRPPLLLLKMFL